MDVYTYPDYTAMFECSTTSTCPVTDPSLAAELSREIGKILIKPEVRRTAVEEVIKASESARAIRNLFQSVKNDLEILRESGIVLRYKLRKYPERWTCLSERFEDLLKSSRQEAIEASTLMDRYVTLLKGGDIHSATYLQDLRIELDSFLQHLDDHHRKAVSLSADFMRLSSEIDAFRLRLGRLGDVSKKMNEARNKLFTLKKYLQRADQERTDKWTRAVSIIVSLAMVAGQAAVAILTMSPMTIGALIVGIVNFVTNLITAERERKKSLAEQQELLDCQRKIDDLLEQQRLIAEFTETFNQSTNEKITNIIKDVQAVSHFWEKLRLDVVKLRASLIAAINDKATENFFRLKMDAASDIYATLIVLYDEYAKNTDLM